MGYHFLLQEIFLIQGLNLHLGITNFLRDTRHLVASGTAQRVKNLPAMQETQMWVPSSGQEDPLEEEMATYSSLGALVTQSCLILCDPMDCSPPGFSVHGILQARILEWVAIPFSRGSSRPRDRTLISFIAGGF